jgi:hypothetical protein
MASFAKNEIDVSKINNGQRYQNGDVVDAEAINTPIEASYYAQETAKDALQRAAAALDKVKGALGETSAFSLLDVYQIGSIYMSVLETSPALLFGGDWEALQDRFLLGAGSLPANLLGGHTNLLLSAAIGAFDNDTASLGYCATSPIMDENYGFNYGFWHSDNLDNISTGRTNHSTRVYDWVQKTDNPSLYPPYLTVYMWKRIG